MTPKKMIKAEIVTLKKMADSAKRRADDSTLNLNDHNFYKGELFALEDTTRRLESLLKLEGWE